MTTSRSTSALSDNVHKVAYALAKRCQAEVHVARMPLVKQAVCFAFTIGGREVGIYGSSYFTENLSVVATRLYTEYRGLVDGPQKSNASSKGRGH